MSDQTKLKYPSLLLILAAVLLWLGDISGAAAGVTVDITDPLLQTNILAYMRLDDEACDAPEWRVRRLFEDADTEISDALEVVGYYNVTIDKSLQQNDTCWQADFHVKPGQPVVLRDVSIIIATGETGASTDPELQATVELSSNLVIRLKPESVTLEKQKL